MAACGACASVAFRNAFYVSMTACRIRLVCPDAEDIVEHDQARFRPVDAAKPDRRSALQIADDDAIDVPFPNGDLVDADHLGLRVARPRQLRAHIEFVHLFDGVPIEVQISRHFLDGGPAALLPNVEREPFRVVRIAREPVEPLLLHAATPAAIHAAHLDFEIDTQIAAREVAHPTDGSVVPGAAGAATYSADRFFWRRVKVMTRARGSPKIPTIVRLGVKPENR